MADYYVDIDGKVTRKKKKKATYSVGLDGTVTRNYDTSESGAYGKSAASKKRSGTLVPALGGKGLLASAGQNRSGVTAPGNSTVTSPSPISTATQQRQESARRTAEENVLKQYGTYEQFRQKNLSTKNGQLPGMEKNIDTMNRAAYDKLIQKETDRILSESYEKYRENIDNTEADAKAVLEGAQAQNAYMEKAIAEQDRIVQDLTSEYNQMERNFYTSRANIYDPKAGEELKYKKEKLETEQQKLAELRKQENDAQKQQKEAPKKQEWTKKQRENLKKIQEMSEEDKNLFWQSMTGYSSKEEDEKYKYVRKSGDITAREKKAARKELLKRGYSKSDIDSISDTLERAQNAEDAAKFREETKKNANGTMGQQVAASAKSVAANLVSGVGIAPGIAALTEEVSTGEYVPIDTNSPLYRPGEYRDITRQEVAENIGDSVDNKVAKKVLPMLYSAGMSNIDNLTAAFLGGGDKAGEIVSLGTMATGAAASGTQEAFNRTGDTKKAFATGTAAGLIEYGTEKISLDRFWEIVQKSGAAAGRNWLVNLLVQSGIEGSEEVASDIANRVVDDAVNGGMSEYNQNVQAYMEQGLSRKAAEKQATKDFLSQVVESFSAGAMAGAMGGGAATIINKVRSIKQGSNLSENGQAVVDTEVDNRIAEEEKSGRKLKRKEKAAIREQVESDLAKGRISIDTIEKVLGGETYEKYRSAVEQEEALTKEFNTLNKMKQGEMTGEQIDRRAELKEQLEELKKNSNKKQLKEQLSREVEELSVNDEFLRESYNERGRRREAYQVDENTKYSEKQKEIVQKAADSGILNNTRRTHEFVDMVAKISADKGVNFEFSNNERIKQSGFALEGKSVNGFVKDGNITLNIESNQVMETVAGHEITHILEGTELYSALQQAVKEYATTKGEYDSRLAAVTELYKDVEGANVENELTADLVGEYLFKDADFVKNLSAKHQNLFQRIFSEIKYMLKTATAGSKEARQLEKVKRAFEEAYRENTNNDSEGLKYSLMEFSRDGRRFVEIDQDQDRFDGHDRSEYPRIAKDIINEKFNGKVIGIDNQMFVNGRGRDEFSNPSKYIQGNVYEAKMRSAGELDNLLDAGTNLRTEADGRDGHYHPDAINGFDYYDTLFKIGHRYYEAVVNIKNIERGRLFKDVTKIKDVTQDIMSSYGENPKSQFLRTSSTDSVPQSQQNASGNSKKSGEVTHSLSGKDDIAPIDRRYTYGRDIALEQEGIPIRQDIAGKEIAPAQKEGSKYITEQDVDEYLRSGGRENRKRRERYQNGKQIIVKNKSELRDFVKKSIATSNTGEFAVYGKVSDEFAQRVKEQTNGAVDITGYFKELSADDLRHAYENHKYPKETGDMGITLQELVDSLDSLEDFDIEKTVIRKDGRKSIELSKKVDGGTIINIEVISKSTGSIRLKTEWKVGDEKYNRMYKKSSSNTVGNNSSVNTTHFDTASATSIPQSAENVTQNIETENNDTWNATEESWENYMTQAEEEAVRDMTPEQKEKFTRKKLHRKIIDNIKAKFEEKGFDFDAVLSGARNKSTWSSVDNTPQRFLEKTLGYKEGQLLSDLTVNQTALNESEAVKWLNSFTDRKNGLLKQISEQYKIKPGSKESAAAQKYGEGFYMNKKNEYVKYGDAELAKDFPDIDTRKRIKGLAKDERIRQIYDETLEKINESRTRNAYPEIPKRDNYFLHFQAMEDAFSKLGIPFNPETIMSSDLPTDINGMTADLKPGQPYFASANQRKGVKTTYDLLGGIERYLNSAKNQIYHIDDIQTLRALRNYVADMFGQAKGFEGLDELSQTDVRERIKQIQSSHLSVFAKFLNEEANTMAGKTAMIDRALEGMFGRRAIRFIDTVNKQVGSNMVGFNISPAGTNIGSAVQAFAKSNKFDSMKAVTQMISNKVQSIRGNSDGFVENDPLCIRRKGVEKFARTPWDKVKDAGYVMAGVIDDASTEFIVRCKYNELTRKGMEDYQAHIEADKWAAKILGDRSYGQQPLIYNSKMLGLVTKFQLEVRNNLDNMFYDTLHESGEAVGNIQNVLERNSKIAAKTAATVLRLAVYQHLFGIAFEAIAGYNPTMDLIEIAMTLFGFDDEEDSEDTPLDNLEQALLALLDDLPYTSTFTGGRIPISSALPIQQLITEKDNNGNKKSRGETLKEALPYYILPTGYGQLKKTVKGLSMFSDKHPVSGSYTKSGNLRFPVEDTVANRIKAGMFGQYASKNARDYFDNGRSPLNEKQIQEYKDLDIPIQDYWKYREGLKGLTRMEDKAEYIAGLDLPISKKNILINNASGRKEQIDLTGYENFKDFEEFDFSIKNPAKYEFLKNNDISYQKYSEYKSHKEAYDWAYQNQEKFEVAKAAAGDAVAYRKYAKAIDGIKADQDSSGKAVSGSRKQKVTEYINGLDLDYGQKLLMYKDTYTNDNTYNQEIVDYLNSREDISYHGMETILKELGFTVEADGTVRW